MFEEFPGPDWSMASHQNWRDYTVRKSEKIYERRLSNKGVRDRATYDPSTTAKVVYSVSAASAAPTALTFGPSFMSLAATYSGSVVLGLNRGHDNISNTIAAAKVAKSAMGNLLAIELGNEPECKKFSRYSFSLTNFTRLGQRWPGNCHQFRWIVDSSNRRSISE